MRSVFIPSRGDPITFRLVMYFFQTVWKDEVDKLYVNVNSSCEKEVIDYIESFCKDPKVVFSYDDHFLDHGNSLTKMFKQGNEEFIGFMEDDSLVYKKGAVDKHFKYIESGGYDAVGVLRWSCSGELIDRGREIFKLYEYKYGPGGWFWPCFFFAKRSDIAKTELNFCGKNFKKGENIEPLSWTPEMNLASDTFVYFSMQMRALNLRFLDIPTPCDVTDPSFSWVHTTSLSSPMEYILLDKDGYAVARRKSETKFKAPEFVPSDLGEITKKFAWMTLCLEKFWDEFDKIRDFRDVYKDSMERYIDKFSFDKGQIRRYVDSYKISLGI